VQQPFTTVQQSFKNRVSIFQQSFKNRSPIV